MVPEIAIWRSANLLIRKHGANAEREAAKRADLMLDRGDDDGRLLWMRIRRAIEAGPAADITGGTTDRTLSTGPLGAERPESAQPCRPSGCWRRTGIHPTRRFAAAAADIGFAPDSGRSDVHG
jgi:hypothetical protein